MPVDIARIVALGASNLTRGFCTVVATARATWGPEIQVLAALGHGRSYGARSRVLGRTLPGILESGLWRALESSPRMPTRALVTDVGNDILYGFSAEQILGWLAEALGRLEQFADHTTLTDLPLFSIRQMSPLRYLTVRSVLFPCCRLSFEQVLATAERVNAGVAELAGARGARLIRLAPSWYGLDPIHIRRTQWKRAWQEILGTERGGERSIVEAVRMYRLRPERRWVFGVEQFTPQAGTDLPGGARVWLY